MDLPDLGRNETEFTSICGLFPRSQSKPGIAAIESSSVAAKRGTRMTVKLPALALSYGSIVTLSTRQCAN